MVTIVERLERRHRLDGACWTWTGKLDRDGYGVIVLTTRGHKSDRRVHRVAFDIFNGYTPVEVDHTCRNRACFNPAHLEDVDHTENIRRAAALVVECPAGHPYDDANTRYTHGRRFCRACNREAARRIRVRKRAH